MEKYLHGPSMGKSVELLRGTLLGISAINTLESKDSAHKTRTSSNINFDDKDFKEKYEKQKDEIETLKSLVFTGDLSVAEKKLTGKYTETLTDLGISMITLPAEDATDHSISLHISDPEKFIKYLTFIDSPYKNMANMEDLGGVLMCEIKTILKISALEAFSKIEEGSFDNFFKHLPKILEKLEKIEKGFFKPILQNNIKSSIYILNLIKDAQEKLYLPEFSNFFSERVALLYTIDSFRVNENNFLNILLLRTKQKPTYFKDYTNQMLSHLKNALHEYKSNKYYGVIFNYLYNFMSSLSMVLRAKVPRELSGDLKTFEKELETMQTAFQLRRH